MSYRKERCVAAEFFIDSDGSLWLTSMYTWEDSDRAFDNWRAPAMNDLGRGDGFPIDKFGGINYYDVDWCKRDQIYLYHMSGGGGKYPITVRGVYWSKEPGYTREAGNNLSNRASSKRNRTRRLEVLPFEIREDEDLLEYLEDHAVRDDSIWCSVCMDHLPGSNPCGHIWWCEEIGDFSTPSDRHECPECVGVAV